MLRFCLLFVFQDIAHLEDRCHALEDEIEQYMVARDAYEQQLSSMAKSLSNMEEQLRHANQEKVFVIFVRSLHSILLKRWNAQTETMFKPHLSITVSLARLGNDIFKRKCFMARVSLLVRDTSLFWKY